MTATEWTTAGAAERDSRGVVERSGSAFQESRETSKMWEVSFELLATVRSDGYLQQVNPRWQEVLGWTEEELFAKPFAELVHPDDRQRTATEAARLEPGGHESISFENRCRCSDGSYRWLRWNSMASEDGLTYTAAHDITERRSQAAALAATEARLRLLSEDLEAKVGRRTSELMAANRELEAFSYSVSHDLRAPLRAIDGFSQAVLEDCGEELPDSAKDDLMRVRSASQRMATMIDEMLALSRLTRQDLRNEPVDLSGLAHEVAGELRQLDDEREVRIEIEPGLEVTGDPTLLRQVIYNLLENAWKFTANAKDAHVEMSRFGVEQGHSTFVVRDNGAGFDMRYADKLFRPFERLHGLGEFSGTGVGLTTVARILSRHGGRIWAQGAPGDGASFFFDLPTGEERDA